MKHIIPKYFEHIITSNKYKYYLYRLKCKILRYWRSVPVHEITQEQKEAIDYLKHNSLSVFPYHFEKKYKSENIQVYRDEGLNLPYVIQDNKRLYFKKDWDETWIRLYYNGLLIEQDTESPHRYESSQFSISYGDILADVGTAEGNFALSVIEKVNRLYLFEAESTWIEALQATFEPWKEKVVIINKYVSNNDNINNISLDTFFKDKKVDFIKADIEGAETLLLTGAKEVLSRCPLKITLCTYHRQNDANEINQILWEHGFKTEFSKGYMVFYYDDTLSAPYFRRGLVRACKHI